MRYNENVSHKWKTTRRIRVIVQRKKSKNIKLSPHSQLVNKCPTLLNGSHNPCHPRHVIRGIRRTRSRRERSDKAAARHTRILAHGSTSVLKKCWQSANSQEVISVKQKCSICLVSMGIKVYPCMTSRMCALCDW